MSGWRKGEWSEAVPLVATTSNGSAASLSLALAAYSLRLGLEAQFWIHDTGSAASEFGLASSQHKAETQLSVTRCPWHLPCLSLALYCCCGFERSESVW